jgi:hypothetical protein
VPHDLHIARLPLKLEFLLLRLAFLLLLPLPLVSILQRALTRVNQPSYSKSEVSWKNSTYLCHHVTEVLLLVPKLLFLSSFFIPVALSEENRSDFGRTKKKTLISQLNKDISRYLAARTSSMASSSSGWMVTSTLSDF